MNTIKHLTESEIVLAKNTFADYNKYITRGLIPTYEGRMPSYVESYPEHDGTVYMDTNIPEEEFVFIRDNVYGENASMNEEEAFAAIGIRFVYDDGDNFYYYK